jgi:hypothetical protein
LPIRPRRDTQTGMSSLVNCQVLFSSALILDRLRPRRRHKRVLLPACIRTCSRFAFTHLPHLINPRRPVLEHPPWQTTQLHMGRCPNSGCPQHILSADAARQLEETAVKQPEKDVFQYSEPPRTGPLPSCPERTLQGLLVQEAFRSDGACFHIW